MKLLVDAAYATDNLDKFLEMVPKDDTRKREIMMISYRFHGGLYLWRSV